MEEEVFRAQFALLWSFSMKYFPAVYSLAPQHTLGVCQLYDHTVSDVAISK